MTTITHLTSEYRTNPLGIDVTQPRFAWQMQTDRQGARQTAYRVLAASRADLLSEGSADLWDSGRVESDQSVQVPYAGRSLASRQRVYWKVTVWDETGSANQSETAWFELGLLNPSDWQAQWIGSALSGGPHSMLPAPYLRQTFSLSGEIASARLYVTALGIYECSINGKSVSEDVFAPGWTNYHKRVQYNAYDVTALLHAGDNAIGAILGDGWAAGYVGWTQRQQYVDRPQFLAQLEVTLRDGSRHIIATERTWKYQFGSLTHADFQMGEAYDARKDMPGWDTPAFDAARWVSVEVFQHPDLIFSATNGPTVRRIEERAPVDAPVNKGRFGRRGFIYDMGQNMVGRVRFKGSAPAGTTITLRFAEVLNPDGSLYTTNLRGADATDYYTFKDSGEVVWEPKFTFHGFRYVQLDGYPNEATRDTITGIVLHSDTPPTGDFECSDPTITQLQQNIIWGQKGNFVDVPTDCPQRDERLGWTGDIQVFARTAAFNMDIAGFMTKWARDVADAQGENGEVPSVVPYAADPPRDGGPAWSDAAVICPYTIYLCYGDTRILDTNYDTMTRFMEFLLNTSPGLIRCAPEFEGWPGFGDWLSINANTPRDLIGTAFLAYDANLMAQIASVLGKTEDAAKYGKLFEDAKAAFGARFLFGSKIPASAPPVSEMRRQMDSADSLSRGSLKLVDYGPVTSQVFNSDLFEPTQTAYVLALYFDLLPEAMRPLAVSELVADIERRGMHLSTGFVGSPYLNHVLSEGGRADVAYELLNQKGWPSWLYAVTQGATTIWERWDGWTEESGFQTPEMNSFNHYAYGAIGAWLYQTVAGIEVDPSQPGYKHAILRPQPGGGLTHACGSLKTAYGELVSEWRQENGTFEYSVVVPPNTTASVYLPVQSPKRVTVNGQDASGTVHELEAGAYRFVVE